MRKIPAVPGEEFNRLTIVEEIAPDVTPGGHISRKVRCKCECGVIKDYHFHAVRRELSKSCGCYRNEQIQKATVTHGASMGQTQGSPLQAEYRTWRGMLARCKSGNVGAENYGNRGIKVCQRWQEGYLNFLEDMGPKPGPEHSLDRIDVNGDYTPENCRWATRAEQMRNTRRAITATIDGVTKPIAEWCEYLGISYDLVRHRIYAGWAPATALTTPKKLNRHMLASES